MFGLPRLKLQSDSDLAKFDSELNLNKFMSSDSKQRVNGSKLNKLKKNPGLFVRDSSHRNSSNPRSRYHHHRNILHHRHQRSYFHPHHYRERLKYLKTPHANLKNVLLNLNLDNRLNEDYFKKMSFKSFESLKVDSNSKPILISSASNLRKKDRCKTLKLKHKIVEKDCLPKMITNKYCYGQCNSFFIPTHFDIDSNSTENEAVFKTCSLCRPKKFEWISLKLYCPTFSPPFKIQKVQLIQKCKCLNDPSLV